MGLITKLCMLPGVKLDKSDYLEANNLMLDNKFFNSEYTIKEDFVKFNTPVPPPTVDDTLPSATCLYGMVKDGQDTIMKKFDEQDEELRDIKEYMRKMGFHSRRWRKIRENIDSCLVFPLFS
ncbi:hypothetical protein ACOSP7_013049 [Xanthoceras sorbifolium]